MTTSLKWIATLAVAASVSLTSLSSGATTLADDAPKTKVKAWDLDLARPGDVQTLYERVHAAANDLCRTEAQRYWHATRRAAPLGWRERCVTDAVDAAVGEIGNRRLATLHAGGAPRRLL